MSISKGRSLLASQSLLDTRPLSADDIFFLFEHADELLERGRRYGNFFDPRDASTRNPRVVCCLFFEPSTRTRMSFQTAAYKLGHQVLTMELSSGSSLSKGETYGDTVLNIAAMKPDVMVIRYGRSEELDELLPQLSVPVINAGNGTMAHPTQGLLDAYTIQREFGKVQGLKVLIVGDIRHSRVARSNFDILAKLGAEIGVCGPESMMPQKSDQMGDEGGSEFGERIRVFSDLDEAIAWADVYMGLRIQLERHDAADLNLKSLDEYHRHFGLNRERLKKLRKDAIIMHPGPINHGVEFSKDVMSDPRSRVLTQVKNGVTIRAALLSVILGSGGPIG